MDRIQRGAYDVWHDKITLKTATDNYVKYLKEVEAMIMLHYYAGSIFDTNFWKFAKDRASDVMEEAINDLDFYKILINYKDLNDQNRKLNHSTWTLFSYYQNITNLGLCDNFGHLLTEVPASKFSAR